MAQPKWLLEIKPKVPPTLMFGRAINYALSAWNHLLNYLDYPELFVDNSIAERSIKPFVIGRKNWLFSGSETGAESSCFLFTLIENAKLYKLERNSMKREPGKLTRRRLKIDA